MNISINKILKYRINKYLRWGFFLITIFIALSFIQNIYKDFRIDQSKLATLDNIIKLVCLLVLVEGAIRLMKIIYIVTDELIIEKRYFKKDKIYPISNILKVEEIKVLYPLNYVNIILKESKSIKILPIDNQSQFIKILNEKIGECSE